MFVVDAGIDDRYDAGGRSRRHVPGQRGLDVSAGYSWRANHLTDVAQTPKDAERRIVRESIRLDDIVGFRVRDIRVVAQEGQQRRRVTTSRVDAPDTDTADR